MQIGSFAMLMALVVGLVAACASPNGDASGASMASESTARVGQDLSGPAGTPLAAATATLAVTDTVAAQPTATASVTPAPPTPTASAPEPSAPAAPSATRTSTSSPGLSSTATATATLTASPTPRPTATDPPQDTEDLIANGMEVYKERYCGVCHQLGASGIGGLFGPTHDGMGVTAAGRIQEPGYGGGATTAAEYLRESIVSPKAFVVSGYEITSHPMPAFDFLSEQEIMALVQMLLAQR